MGDKFENTEYSGVVWGVCVFFFNVQLTARQLVIREKFTMTL